MATESPLKLIKNVFFITLEAVFLRYLNFGLIFVLKAKFNFKIYYVIDWKTDNYNTNIAQYMTMKFGQLVECNLGSILEKSHAKCGEETSPEPFSLDQQSEILYSFFSLYVGVEN